MASAAIVTDAPPMVDVKNIFFKAHPPINYFADEAEADAIDNEVAFQNFNRSLECSNKHGCVLLTFNNAFYLLRISDILSAQNQSSTSEVTFKDLKKLEIRNDALPVTPNIIALSTGEDYLAVDTVRGDSAWAVIFKISDFINQGGSCRPFCEVRCSSAANSKISSISWNPGDGFTNLVAVNTEDGALFLAKIVGPNNMELNRFVDGGIRCCCWSPKGKQLVVGRANGNLSQLRLDLTEAKQIPGPKPEYVPISILWTQTTQFLVIFRMDSYIDFMQLDVPKGTPPMYTNSGDIFISEIVPTKCSCYFIPLTNWNVVLATTNSGSDIMVLVKEQQNSTELWLPGDITDNRRAAFFLDNYARGACVYYAYGNQVTFSEVESYAPMPMLLLLSQRGSLLLYSIVNSDPQAASMNVSVSSPIPDTVFSSNRQPLLPQPSIAPNVPQTSANVPFFQAPQQPSSFIPPTQPQILQIPTPAMPSQVNKPPQSASLSFSTEPSQKTKSVFGLPVVTQAHDTRQLGTSTLPTAQDMAGLQKAVEEKRREMTTQLQKGVSLKGLEDDDQCVFVISEVRKFEQRLAEFKSNVDSNRGILSRLVNTSFDALEKRVLSILNVVEDFSSDMVSTTSAQKEEVAVLKERILNHFSQLEYAKSLVERSRDPRYLEHLRSRPMDPASQQKFEEIKKLHNYLQTQVAECRRYFYEQSRKRDMPIDRVSYTQLIYLTLSNHSKIIRRLKCELDSIKERLGLGRHNSSYDDAEYLAVCEASYSNVGIKKSATSASSDDPDEITLNDLTAGISKVKLNRESDRPDKKPVKLANRKLYILKKCMPEVTVIKVKADETSWTRSPSKTASRPKTTAHQTAVIDGAISRMMDSKSEPDTQIKSGLSSTTFTVKSETPPLHTNTPQQFSSNMPTSFMGIPSHSPTIDFSSIIKSSMTNVTVPSNLNKQTSSPSTATLKSNEMSFVPNLQPPSSGATISILKSPIQASSNSASISPSTQLPTLAGLLATPVSTMPSNLFSTFTNTAASNTAKQEKGLSFGTGQFSFAAQQVDSASSKVLNSTTSSNTSFIFQQSGGVSAPAPSSVMPINFGTATLSSTISTSSIISSPSVSSATGIFAGGGMAGFPNKSTTTFAASTTTPLFSSGNLTSVTAGSKVIAVPVTGFTSSDSSDSIKTSTVGSTITAGGGGGLFSSGSVLNTTSGNINTFTGNGSSTKTVSGGTVSNPKETQSTLTSNDKAPVVSSVGTSVTTSVTATLPSGLQITSITGPSPAAASTKAPISSTNLQTSVESTSIFGDGKINFGIPTSTGQTSKLFSALSATETTVPTAAVRAESSPVATITPLPTTELSVTPQSATTGSTAVTTLGGLLSTPPISTTSSGLFSTVNTTSTSDTLFIAAASQASGGLFSSPATTTVSSSQFASPPVSTVSQVLFTGTPAATTSSGLFSTVPTSTAPTGLFSSVPVTSTVSSGLFSSPSATTSSSGLFSTPPASTTSGGLFSSIPAPTTAGGLFSTTPASTASGGLFSSVPSTTVSTTSTGLFGTSSFFSPTTTTSTLPGTGFMSSLSISDPSSKPATTTSTSSGGLFSSSTFGTAATSTASIFGGGGAFGSQLTTPGQTGNSASTTQTGFGVFGQSKPTAGVFGTPASPTATAAPVFGGSATFGGSSPFGSSFGGTGASTFGATTGSAGVFGSSTTSTTQSTGFGSLAQQSNTTSTFGGSPFGAGSTSQQQGSLFGTPTQQKPTSGLFSSFGSPAATSAGVFGGGGSVFGTTTAAGGGAFSAGTGTGGVAQQGFGFSQAKPSTAAGFGSPPAAAPVFGGGATFGSSSPFGSTFASSPASTFGSTGGSVFGGGGGASAQNAGFGSLAQQGAASPGFGGSTAFGATQSPQQPSLFGSPQQQQQVKPVFGGQAFSSWR